MEIGKFLSLKDFFNYYVAGSIWLIDLFLIVISLPNKSNILALFGAIPLNNTIAQTIILGILTLVFPYTVGFVLSDIGGFITGVLYKWFGNPYKWVADHKDKRFDKRHLSLPVIKKIASLSNNIFGFDVDKFIEKPELYFFQIRAYITNKDAPASNLAARSIDLANFAESLLIPFPLTASLTIYHLIPSIISSITGQQINEGFLLTIKIIASIAAFIFSFLLIVNRHLRLKEYWVKHVYRAFVVLATSDIQEKTKKIEKVSEEKSK